MQISKILGGIKDKEIVIPEFQREYVWSLGQSKDLVISLFKRYPTGSILIWDTTNPPEIKNDAIDENKIGRTQVLLDGQQRLTTLYLFIKGEVPPYYNEQDITYDPRHLYFNLKTSEFKYYQRQEMERSPFWKSVVECFNQDINPFVLIENLNIEDSNEKLKIGNIINKNLSQLKSILEIDYFVQFVPEGVSVDKAIDIFDKVNSRGTKLTDAELVLTHIAGKWPQVRREIKVKIEDYEKQVFKFNLDFFTRCIVILLTGSALFKKMTSEIYEKTSEENYKEIWAKIVKVFDYLIPILKQSAFVGGTDDINTNNVFVPIVAYIANNDGAFKSDQEKNNFLYWMFLALIWGRYSGQTDQRLDKDVYLAINNSNPVDSLIEEIKDQRGRIEIKPSDLEGRGSGNPLHRILYIISKSMKAIDWSDGGSIQDTMGSYYSIQSHHIFPQSFLYKNGYNSENHLDKKKVNEIANRAFITRDTNYNISAQDPAIYLPKVKSKYPEALKRHFIPEREELWTADNYEQFLTERRRLIADNVNRFLSNFWKQETHIEEEINYREIINKGENNYIEFKSSLRWDLVNSNVNKLMEHSIAKTIASFMNVEGGKLFIGVNDEGEVLGLNADYETLHKKNKDGFLLQLTQVINQYIGKEFHQYASYEIVKIEDKDMCVVSIGNSDSPAYIKTGAREEFFIRASASSQPMSIRESNEYIKVHWNNQNA